MSIFSDFIDTAQSKIGEVQARYETLPTSPTDSVGSSIFNALYSYGAGYAERARTQLGAAILKTGAGQNLAAEVERQRLQQMLPWIIGAIILVLGAGFLVAKR
jgi:hypothetical protein